MNEQNYKLWEIESRKKYPEKWEALAKKEAAEKAADPKAYATNKRAEERYFKNPKKFKDKMG